MKIRRIDFSPDEFLVGTLSLTEEECGLYWRACALIYSVGGPVEVDHLRAVSKLHGRSFNVTIARLVETGKLYYKDGLLSQKRCEKEIENALKRSRKGSENISKRWRKQSENKATSAEINEVADEVVLLARLPSTINHQPSTNKEKETTPDGVSKKAAPRRSRIDPGWQVDERDIAYALGKGRDQEWIDRQSEMFRDHHLKSGSLFVDWHAAWRTWVQRSQQYERTNGQSKSSVTAATERWNRSTQVMLDTLAERERAAAACH